MEDQEITVSLKDILNVIKKNLIFIIVMVIVFSIGSFFVTKFFIPKSYTSSVLLYVDTDRDNGENYSSANDLNSYNYAQKLVATYIKALDTNSFYSSVSNQINEKYSAGELKNMISFVNDEETEIFEAVVVTNSPSESKKIADAVAVVAPDSISNLKSNATLKIVDAATTPQNPSSPSVSRNVILAFALAVVISLVISFLREFLDAKIKYDEEMTALGKYPILSAVPDFEYFNDKKRSKNNKR